MATVHGTSTFLKNLGNTAERRINRDARVSVWCSRDDIPDPCFRGTRRRSSSAHGQPSSEIEHPWPQKVDAAFMPHDIFSRLQCNLVASKPAGQPLSPQFRTKRLVPAARMLSSNDKSRETTSLVHALTSRQPLVGTEAPLAQQKGRVANEFMSLVSTKQSCPRSCSAEWRSQKYTANLQKMAVAERREAEPTTGRRHEV